MGDIQYGKQAVQILRREKYMLIDVQNFRGGSIPLKEFSYRLDSTATRSMLNIPLSNRKIKRNVQKC